MIGRPRAPPEVRICDGEAADAERAAAQAAKRQRASSGPAAVPAPRVVTPLYEVDVQREDGGGALCGRGIISGDERGEREKYASLCGVVMRIDRLTWVQHPRGRQTLADPRPTGAPCSWLDPRWQPRRRGTRSGMTGPGFGSP